MPARLVLTRDGGTSLFNAYLNGAPVLSFTDGGNIAFLNSTDRVLQFFQDDRGGGEASPGVVTLIGIFDDAITAQQAMDSAGVGAPLVPEPGTWLGGAALCFAGFWAARHRRKPGYPAAAGRGSQGR